MKKFLLLIPFLLFADINPFNAGNLNSTTPYGLTPDEQAILANKKNIQKLTNSIEQIKNKLAKIEFKLSNYDNTLKDKISALPTMIDEINSAMNNIAILKKDYNLTQENIKFLKEKIDSLNNRVNSLEQNITAIKKSIKEIVIIQNQNFNDLKQSIIELLNKINQLNKPLSAKEAFNLAKKYYIKKDYDRAKKYFLYSLSKNYMPATSSFYLGEVAYKQKKYKEALAYYKKSIKLYPKKAWFTPILLYHTAKSFLYLKNKKAAKLSFEKLITDFPKSKYAKLAKKDLAKLN